MLLRWGGEDFFSLQTFNHEHTTTKWIPFWTVPLFSRCGPYSGRVGSWCHWHVPAPPIRHKWLTPMRQHMDWAHVTPVRESGVCPTRPVTLQSGVSKINQRRNALTRHKRNFAFQPNTELPLVCFSNRNTIEGKIIKRQSLYPVLYWC
jgi:hypothetical protein